MRRPLCRNVGVIGVWSLEKVGERFTVESWTWALRDVGKERGKGQVKEGKGFMDGQWM